MPSPTLLIVSDVAPTGYGRISRLIGEALADDFKIVQLGTNYGGDPHDRTWPVYRASASGDNYGFNRIIEIVELVKPAAVLLYNDLWAIEAYCTELSRLKTRPMIVAHAMIEGGPVLPKAIPHCSILDAIVSCTVGATDQFREAFSHFGKKPRFLTIPHFVDTSSFHKMRDLQGTGKETSGKMRARRRVLRNLELRNDQFIIFNGNRNQPRKRIDLTMEAFSIFSRGKPGNVKLFLHMGLKDSGWDLPLLAAHFGIQDRCIFSAKGPHTSSLSSEDLNYIYNCCDVGINTAYSEGWGLVAFEHALTGAPQIMGAHSACGELWSAERGALMVMPTVRSIDHSVNLYSWTSPAEAFAEALEVFYTNRDMLEEYGRRAMSHALSEEFSLASVGSKWRELFLDHQI